MFAVQTGKRTPEFFYLCKDNLGSITAVMNTSGNIVEEYNYDPWGRRRNPADWSYSNVSTPTYTHHGFTGHEHLDMFNLINMNGRIYDSEIARFLSPDPIIQDPYNLLSYNRYSYCLNNPLKYTDPSGYSRERILRDMEENEKNDPGGSVFYNNYPAGWSESLSYSAISHYGNMTYQYNWDRGVYTDKFGRVVSYEEVYYNYILPKSQGENEISLGPNKPTLKIKWSNFPEEEKKWLKRKFQIELEVKGDMYECYNWIQTASREGLTTFIDPDIGLYNGFYYPESQMEYYTSWKGLDGYFEDAPNPNYFDAELSLVGKRNDRWEVIENFSWGYSYSNKLGFYQGYFLINSNPSKFHQESTNYILRLKHY